MIHSRSAHVLRVVAAVARERGAVVDLGPVTCRLVAVDLAPVIEALASALSVTELDATRAVLGATGDDGDPLAHGMGAVPLGHLVARERHGHLTALLGSPERFHALYQPIVDLADGRVVAFEALLRATADDGSEIGAVGLFPPAAAMGVTHTVDRIGRETAIRDAAPFLADRDLFINFIPTSIYRPELCLVTTEAAAHRHGICLDQLVFEVTESEKVQDTGHLLEIVRHYRDRGARVALDDVGSGYASLELVQELRPDVLKIDRSLISRLPAAGARAIVGALVAVGREIGAQVLAEGVETEQEAATSQALGVDLAQGWYFGRPERQQAAPTTLMAG